MKRHGQSLSIDIKMNMLALHNKFYLHKIISLVDNSTVSQDHPYLLQYFHHNGQQPYHKYLQINQPVDSIHLEYVFAMQPTHQNQLFLLQNKRAFYKVGNLANDDDTL